MYLCARTGLHARSDVAGCPTPRRAWSTLIIGYCRTDVMVQEQPRPSRSRDLFDRACKTIPSGVNSPVRYFEPHPVFITRSQGAYIWDADGNRLTDLCCGYGALLLGHRRQEIISAVSEQLLRGTLYCSPTSEETDLAELVTGNFPSMDKVRLVNTGSEATMTAIRLARGFTKRRKIIKFEGGYHGAHDSVLVSAGSGQAHHGISTSEGGLEEVSQNTLVARYNDPSGLEETIRQDGDVAGVIIEPIMANMGLILPQDGFLQQVRRITQKNDIPLIFDEVVTGFRVSPGGAQQHYGVKPDITTLAKALGGGFAIAAVGGRREIMDNLTPGGRVYQASTFAGNPVAVSAAISSVRTINRIKDQIYPHLELQCAGLSRAVADLASDMGIDAQINHLSSMMQIFFTSEPVTDYDSAKRSDAARFGRLFAELLKNGVFVAPSQFEVVFLSSAHSGEDLDHVLDAYRLALGAIRD